MGAGWQLPLQLLPSLSSFAVNSAPAQRRRLACAGASCFLATLHQLDVLRSESHVRVVEAVQGAGTQDRAQCGPRSPESTRGELCGTFTVNGELRGAFKVNGGSG